MHHYVVTDQVIHAGPSTHVSAEGVIAHSPSIYHGDGERVAARRSRSSDTEACHHHAADQEVNARNVGTEELQASVEFDVYVEGDRENRC